MTVRAFVHDAGAGVAVGSGLADGSSGVTGTEGSAEGSAEGSETGVGLALGEPTAIGLGTGVPAGLGLAELAHATRRIATTPMRRRGRDVAVMSCFHFESGWPMPGSSTDAVGRA